MTKTSRETSGGKVQGIEKWAPAGFIAACWGSVGEGSRRCPGDQGEDTREEHGRLRGGVKTSTGMTTGSGTAAVQLEAGGGAMNHEQPESRRWGTGEHNTAEGTKAWNHTRLGIKDIR